MAIATAQDPEPSRLAKMYSPHNAKKLLSFPLDPVDLAKARLPYEQLDQLTMQVLMGVR